ncbi:MAG TPA: HD domain-containing phosphohydrolase [Pyrinomonadaceae bacterium]|jgi:HD-GYP domain-containing protein (c-di-GMP phosphodiesterase class II)|nr:HD domain-containing phosphohydrolase [Pyrinomonadaceae bacterium]
MDIEFAEGDRAAGESFKRLAKTADEFEAYANPHASRIARIADALAARFRLSRADRTSIVFAALLHDVGEMTMKRDYIGRAGPLNGAERADLQRHPVIGEQEAARAGADRAVQLLVRWHQEWWDGSGYPDALRGEQIPLGARILRAADAYAALTDARPFRPAGTETEARKHLTLWAGLEFDPRVVRALLSLEPSPELRAYARAPQREEVKTPEPAGVEATGEAPDVGVTGEETPRAREEEVAQVAPAGAGEPENI